ncbi:MACPF domain-containing protein At1g14780-like [Magnolia sinica]|uniref:MACPF domain-containing protein At1g14780-like n=1 Tax=Magnolia sinica TaxID=86752 RepID=UPI0026598128|nr:MACPF domain-containing protein At1g14780-like [Magnolia sinica]
MVGMRQEMVEEVHEPIAARAVKSLGLGFDLTSDFRLRFAKGFPGRDNRLVDIDEEDTRDVVIPGGETIFGVSKDIRCDKGDRMRFKSDVLEFNQMSELLNQKSSIQGKVPSGYFNAIFDLTGSWYEDAIETKYLAFDGYFISLYNLHLTASPLVLREKVKKAVPSNWEPALLSRFIQTYGTHIIVGMAVGGQDLVCVRQAPSSSIPHAELKGHLEDLGDYLFLDGRSLSPPLHQKTREGKHKVPEVFRKILNSNNMQLPSFSETSNKDGLTIICSKRGGDASLSSHNRWLSTVPANPDAILFKFVPITSLLTGIPGSGYLSHAINLYLRYKPAPEELQYFLEFQVPRQWAPVFNELPLGPQRRSISSPALQFSFLGTKLHVSSNQVSSGKKPVIGLRLYLEGQKCNRLAIHVQHLSSLPSMVESSWTNSSTSWPCQWRGSDESDSRYLEPVRWKRYSRACTLPIKYNPEWLQGGSDGVFVVTGAQLLTKGRWTKTTLHLRLLFTYLPNCSIQKTEWAQAPIASHKSSFLSNLSTTFTQREALAHTKNLPPVLNSGVYPDGPPVPVHSQKLLRYVETAEVAHGPHNAPGHWLVIGARLVTEGGKIGLHVKFALLNYSRGGDRIS